MKYYLAILLLLIALLLTACMPGFGDPIGQTTSPSTTDPIPSQTDSVSTTTASVPTTTAPVPTTTVPAPTTEPTDPTAPVPSTVPQNDAEMDAFNELFSNPGPERNPYFWATGCEYSSAKEVKLIAFFDGGFLGEHEKTDAEWNELRKMLNYPDFAQSYDFNRLPKEKMEAELQAVFGISLADIPDSAYDGLYYLESTDCYYFFQSGMTSTPILRPFLNLEHNDDGTVSLTYSNSVDNYIITLKPNNDSYLVLSNLKVK